MLWRSGRSTAAAAAGPGIYSEKMFGLYCCRRSLGHRSIEEPGASYRCNSQDLDSVKYSLPDLLRKGATRGGVGGAGEELSVR